MIFTGSAGIGKTYFAAAAFDYAQNIHNTCRYWKELDLLKAIRSQMSSGSGDYLETLEYLIDDDFVIIDDIGSSGLNDWRKEVIFAAIDYRYNSMKPTILISNFSPEEFKEFFHERVGSRLFSKENYIINVQDGHDLRLQGL